MDWGTLLRDVLFVSYTIIVIVYVAQCCEYERQIQNLKDENKRLWRIVQSVVKVFPEDKDVD